MWSTIFSLKWIKFNLFSNPPREHFLLLLTKNHDVTSPIKRLNCRIVGITLRGNPIRYIRNKDTKVHFL